MLPMISVNPRAQILNHSLPFLHIRILCETIPHPPCLSQVSTPRPGTL